MRITEKKEKNADQATQNAFLSSIIETVLKVSSLEGSLVIILPILKL